jgi:hypothetical protein
MAKNIYIVGGSKGGVGKSLITMATIDYLMEHGERVMLIESDTSNPDVWKAYKDVIETKTIDLDEKDGWVDLINICEKNPEITVVVNSAARNNDAVTECGNMLSDFLVELKRKLITLWVINRQRDSLELLKEYMGAISNGTVHVVRNGYFGEEAKFELYNSSKIKGVIEELKGKSVTFPDLADRVSDEIYTQRMSIEVARKSLSIGSRAELSRWRGEVKKMMEQVIDA